MGLPQNFRTENSEVMADQLVGLIGAAIGSTAAIVSSWITAQSKQRSEERTRWYELQLRREDREEQDKKDLAEETANRKKQIANEDQYWADKCLKVYRHSI